MSGVIFWVSVLLIAYVYAGYPLLIAFLARLRREQVYQPGYFPTITLIFAAHNEEKVIAQKLENTLSLDYPRESLQILVADDGSTDRTVEILNAYRGRGVDVVGFPVRKGKLAALNGAIGKARGEILLFSDADNFYPPNALKEAAIYFQDPSIGAVSGGRNVVGETSLGNAEGFYWKYEEFIKRNESRFGNCIGVAGDLLAIRRNLFVAPPAGIINDDFFMALGILKQGYRVVHAPEARSYHPIAGSERGEIERRARMVAGRYQAIFSAWRMLPFRNPVILWQIISHKYLRPLIPFAMIVAFFANLAALPGIGNANGTSLLFLSHPYNWIFMSLQILFYVVAFFGMKVKLQGWIGRLVYLPVFLVNSNIAALRGLYRYVSSNQTVIWNKAPR